MSDDWKQVMRTSFINTHRTGWLGVWDAFNAALSGRDRLVVQKKVTLKLYMKAVNDCCFVSGIEMEVTDE